MVQTGDGIQVGYVGEVTNAAKPQSGSVTWHILSRISAEDELPESVNDTVLVYVSMGHGFGYMETAHYLRREKRWMLNDLPKMVHCSTKKGTVARVFFSKKEVVRSERYE